MGMWMGLGQYVHAFNGRKHNNGTEKQLSTDVETWPTNFTHNFTLCPSVVSQCPRVTKPGQSSRPFDNGQQNLHPPPAGRPHNYCLEHGPILVLGCEIHSGNPISHWLSERRVCWPGSRLPDRKIWFILPISLTPRSEKRLTLFALIVKGNRHCLGAFPLFSTLLQLPPKSRVLTYVSWDRFLCDCR